MLWAAWLVSHVHFFLVFHSLPCPWGAPGIFSRGFVPNWPIWICQHSNFAFLSISCNMIDLFDRIMQTNNKGGNVVINAINNIFMTNGCFIQMKIIVARN